MEDSNSTNLVIIVVLLCVLVFISIYTVTTNFFTKNKEDKTISPGGEEISDNTSIDDIVTNYKKYTIGQAIKLNDNSTWHVIINSASNEDTVTILSDEDIGKISIKNIDTYLEEDYYNNLQQSLEAEDGAIEEIRLLDIDDIISLTNKQNVRLNNEIETQNLEWLYETDTVTSYTENSIPVLICKNDGNNKARLCQNENSDILPVRPVITIKKTYIAK